MKNAILNHYPIISNMFLDETGEVLGPELQSIFRWASEGTNTVDDIHQIQKDLEDPIATKIIDSYQTPVTQIKAMGEDGKIELLAL